MDLYARAGVRRAHCYNVSVLFFATFASVRGAVRKGQVSFTSSGVSKSVCQGEVSGGHVTIR